MPFREYLNQPCDVFFTLEIQPRKSSSGSGNSNSSSGPKREMMMRYRFVTKTLRKAPDICDFSEKFLAQLSKANLKVSLTFFLLYFLKRTLTLGFRFTAFLRIYNLSMYVRELYANRVPTP